ncbi:MAG: SRPBCC family protein [Gemmataceae bacterium]|nr:SRPBCC family protein [Gemmataceae bacterium]
MRIRTFTTEQWLPRPVEEVFAFFSDAGNLDVLTPPWLRFRILTPLPVEMTRGTLLEYRISWRWLPLRWKTEIAAWEPPVRFVDRMLSGPYRQWVHEHGFEAKDGGTLMTDRVDYAVPGWLLEPVVNGWIVGPDVRRIFGYRRAKMQELFGVPK